MKTLVGFAIVGAVCVGSLRPVEAQTPPVVLKSHRPVPLSGPVSLKPAKPYRVVNLKNGSFVIDRPGNWVLNRSWHFEDRGDMAPILIDVVADGVVLDFRGFEIKVEGVGGNPSVVVINVRGDHFTLENATVSICCDGGSLLRSTGYATQIEELTGFSFEPIALEGGGAVLRDSWFHARSGVALSSASTIANTFIGCRAGCVNLVGDENRLLENRLRPGEFLAVRITGSGNVLAGNLVDWPHTGADLATGFDVRGNGNVVRDNTLAAAGETTVAIAVSGSGNVIDGNVAARTAASGSIAVGVRFEQDGNFYGDNRMDATVPFELGATTQTDWGGNVGF